MLHHQIYCCDFNLTRDEQIELAYAALEAIKSRKPGIAARDLSEIGCVLDAFAEGADADELSRDERETMQAIERRLGLGVVWLDPEHLWVRERNGSGDPSGWPVRSIALEWPSLRCVLDRNSGWY